MARCACVCTWLDVLSDDADVSVAVGSCVFMPESDHMTQFMHHDAELVAVLADGDGLRAPTSTAHV